MKQYPSIIVEARRGPIIESYHTAIAAVVSHDGMVIEQYGDPGMETFWRSAAKPVQAMPWVTDGTMAHWGWSSAELAIICGSHTGSDMHASLVASMLTKMGLVDQHLQCDKKLKTRHNCSGNHTGFLAACLYHGWDIDSYFKFDHPAQIAGLNTLAKILEIPKDSIPVGVDGCGILTWATSIIDTARVYAKLPSLAPEISAVMKENPVLIEGEGELDTVLMQSFDGLISKWGAEAIACISLPDGRGLAIKIVDGNERALSAATVPLVCRLMGLEEVPEALAKLASPAIINALGNQVGELVGRF